MWPKALVQLLELVPHVTRLVPMADRYLQSKAEGRDASRRAMEQMADGLRGDLGQMAAAQAGIDHQLNEQHETLSKIAAEVRATRLATDEMEARIARIETRVSRLWVTFIAGVVLAVVIAAGVLSVLAVMHLHPFVRNS